MLLTKRNLEIHAICSTDCTRPSLNNVQITKDHTVATNGHALIKVEQSDDMEPDYPIIASKRSDPMPNAGMLLDHKDAEHIVKQMVKEKNHPLKGLCKVKRVKGNTIELGIADPIAKREQTITYRTHEEQYPNIDGTFPDGNITMAHIRLNANELIRVLQVLRSYDELTHGVDLFVPVVAMSSTPMVIKALDNRTNQKASALIMPLRHDGVDYHGKKL